jgi:hypothetical protein
MTLVIHCSVIVADVGSTLVHQKYNHRDASNPLLHHLGQTTCSPPQLEEGYFPDKMPQPPHISRHSSQESI